MFTRSATNLVVLQSPLFSRCSKRLTLRMLVVYPRSWYPLRSPMPRARGWTFVRARPRSCKLQAISSMRVIRKRGLERCTPQMISPERIARFGTHEAIFLLNSRTREVEYVFCDSFLRSGFSSSSTGDSCSSSSSEVADSGEAGDSTSGPFLLRRRRTRSRWYFPIYTSRRGAFEKS